MARHTDRNGVPVLWHLKVSNYNEKARWALDYKRVPHIRRAAVPGRHGATARKLTGAQTFPVLVLDGEAIGDSTRIIAALEQRYPEPALYPADRDQRRRVFVDLQTVRRRTARAAFPLLRARMKAAFDVDESAVRIAVEKLGLAGERFRAERGPSGYLVGDAFTVADLTLAALVAPLVAPRQFPYPQPQRGHPRLAPLRDALDQSGLLAWTREI